MILDKTKNKFVEVKNHPDAKEELIEDCDYFSCLITDDHRIQLGNQIFWDYDDDVIRYMQQE